MKHGANSPLFDKLFGEIMTLKQQAEKLAELYNTRQITFRDMVIELDKINKDSDLIIYAATPLKDGNGHVKIDEYVPKKYIK